MMKGNWTRGESYGIDIIGDLNAWRIGRVDWNLLLDANGGPNDGLNFCDASIIADTHRDIVWLQPSYYYLGHFSRFVRPNSIHSTSQVSIEAQFANIRSAAFVRIVDDDSGAEEIVIIVMNSGDSAVTSLWLRFCGYSAALDIPA